MDDVAGAGAHVELLEIEDAWLVDPVSGREGRGGIRVEDGRIVEVDFGDSVQGRVPRRGTTVAGRARGGARAEGGRPSVLVLPALVDLHVHLREPGREDAETISTGLAAAAHGGFGTVCAMANTTPAIDSAGLVAQELATARATRSPVRLLPFGAITAGRRGETLAHMGEMADAGAIGFSDDGAPVRDAALFRNALAYAASLGAIIVEHAEEPSLATGAEAHEGLVATILGLKGVPAAAEDVAVARDLSILADVATSYPSDARPRLHLTHLSTAGSIELVRRAKAAGLPVTCDVTPHHLALHDGWVAGDRRWAWDAADEPWSGARADGHGRSTAAAPFDQSTRVNPPLRVPADALALWAGLADGTVDAIATDHAPHSQVDKLVEFGDALPGISGIETALQVVLAGVHAGLLPLATALCALTTGPARVLGQRGGSVSAEGTPLVPGLTLGAPASLLVIDTADTWTVSAESLVSKGRNTPLLSRELRGRVLTTVVDGRFAWTDPGALAEEIRPAAGSRSRASHAARR